jgi:hypothetical protein
VVELVALIGVFVVALCISYFDFLVLFACFVFLLPLQLLVTSKVSPFDPTVYDLQKVRGDTWTSHHCFFF